TGFTVRKAWNGWNNTDDYDDYTVEFAVTRRATARTYDSESGNWVDGAHIDEPLRFLFRSGDGLTTSRTLTISRQGRVANLTPAVSGGTGYNVSYADDDGNWQTALDGLEKFTVNSATSLTFYTYSVEEMCIRNGQGDEIYGYTTTYGLDESALLNDAHQYAGQLIYEDANGQRTTIYGYDGSNMVGESNIAYTGAPGPYVGIIEIYDGATATITNTKADDASLRLNKVVQLHTDLSATVDKSLTNGTYAFTVTGPNNYTKYVRITAATANSATETAYTYETSDDGNTWSAPAAVPAGGVPIEALVPGVYTITEARPALSATLPDGAGMYLKDIDLPDHSGNAINIETRTATVAVGAGGQGRVDVTYTNEVGPDTATMRKMVLDINDSSQADSFESTTEHTWEDTADYDIGDLVPYRVTATLPQAAYQAMDHYYFRIEDKMQNLEPKSWHMYAFVKSPDATTGEVGHWYQVDDYFTFAVDQELTETQNHSMPDTGRTDCVTDELHYLSVVVKMDQTTEGKGLKGVAQGKLVTAWGSDTHSNIPKAEPNLSNVTPTDFDPNHIQYLQLRYYAELLSTAVIGGDPNKPGLGNANDAMLYFDTWDRVGGDYEHTDWDRNRVYTYKLRVNKKDGEAALTGANFRLYKKYKSYVVPDTGSWLTATYNCGNGYWSSFDSAVLNLLDTADSFPSGVTAQTAATNEAELTDVWVPVSGKTSTDGASFDWDGIDDGKYCLFEITAPKGYQGLTSPIGMSVVATHEQEANDPKWRSGYTNIYPDGFIGYFVNENNGAMNLGNMLANIPNTPYPGIDIFKIDGTTRDDAEKPLSGAKFKIGQWNGTNYEDYIPAGGVSAEAETNSAGRVTFPKVEPGEYRISETVLPNGYVKLVDNDIYFSVAYNTSTGLHTITRYDKPADAAPRRQITPTQNTMDVTFAQAHVAVEGDPEYITPEAGETVEQPVVPAIFTVGNMPGAELPSTGGVGPALIYIVGSIFTLLAAALLFRKRTDGQGID
ncbi:MAG: SpaA isopeptide-forming pilin-related protein, partial [bacterium]